MDYLTREVPKRVLQTFSSQKNGHISGPQAGVGEKNVTEIQKRTDLVLSMAGMWGPFVGSETAKQSLRFLWLEECLEGESPFCAGTYSKVSEVISRPAREGADIKLNQTVQKIFGRAEDSNMVSVETTDGSKFNFDELVLTTPLGWLKKHLDAFQPAVPERFQQAVEALGYGNLDKVRAHSF
jgi:flavin-dependent amine oxidoreductase